MPFVSTSRISFGFHASPGGRFMIAGIRDLHTGHEWLGPGADREMLFEFAAGIITDSGTIQDGPVRRSHTDLVVRDVKEESDECRILADAPTDQLTLTIVIRRQSRAAPAVVVSVRVRNNRPRQRVFLRLVLPKMLTLRGPQGSEMWGCVPRELGSASPLRPSPALGMTFEMPHGVPTAMNTMELASLYAADGRGGLFFADVGDGLEGGQAQLQFNLSSQEVVAFAVHEIEPKKAVRAGTLAIGVHPTGDWHHAVDYYTAANEDRTRLPATPPWLREAGGIYGFSGGGAGSIYLEAHPRIELADGVAIATWERDNGPWTDGERNREPQSIPVAISTAGLAPAGSPLIAFKQGPDQVDVVAAGRENALWITWERGGGAWRNGRGGRMPSRISSPNMAPPGALLATAMQNAQQRDVFWAGREDALWVTWAVGDSAWRDGKNGRVPKRITPRNVARPGGGVAAAKQNAGMLDVFWVGDDGAVWVTWEVNDGAWCDGDGGREPLRVSPSKLALPGAPLAAIQQRPDRQLDVFFVDKHGALYVTWEENDGPWRDGDGGRMPVRITPPGTFPERTHLVAHRLNAGTIGVFGIGANGAVLAVIQTNEGMWREGQHLLRRLTPTSYTYPHGVEPFAKPGAPLAVEEQQPGQTDVFFVGPLAAVTLTYSIPGGWTDGEQGRPAPVRVSPQGIAPFGGGVAAIMRPDRQLEAYWLRGGLIASFRDLPVLLKEAAGLGTNVVYLWDYWEGTDASQRWPYWNKGDYEPRADLGGRSDLIRGISAVHSDGGRVIAYLEPFIMFKSAASRAKGERWQGRNPDGTPYVVKAYDEYFIMPAFSEEWQEHVVDVARRLVGDYGFDGVFLDSWAWQMNLRMKAGRGRIHSRLEWSQAVLRLTRRVRDAIRDIRPDTVVLGETTAGPIALEWDGGLAADFWPVAAGGFWAEYRAMMDGRLKAAPARYGLPELNFFSNGVTLGELHQVFAAGYGLALWSNRPGSFMFDHADHIKWLLDTRRRFRNALAYGRQEYQPVASHRGVVAYFYRRQASRAIVLVNTDDSTRTVDVTLAAGEQNTYWQDALTREILKAQGTRLVRLRFTQANTPGGIRILRRVRSPLERV